MDVECGSGQEALLLSIRFDVLGNVGFVFGNTLNEFTASREDVTEVVLMVGGACGIVRGASGTEVGSCLLYESTLDRTWAFNKVAADGREVVILETGWLGLRLRLWWGWRW